MKFKQIVEDRQLTMLETAFGKDIMNYLHDDNIIEIMLNPDGRIHYEDIKKGKVATNIYIDAMQSENILKIIASLKNDIANTSFPEISTELPFKNARFQGWLPPVVKRATFSIRKRAINIFTLDDYVKQDSLTLKQANLLKQMIVERKNILIVGGTGSGKTTFANALLAELKDCKDRIIVIEDLPELQVEVDDLVSMTTTENITMRHLVKGCLRMRPDRIIIGEIRDGTALDLLKAWNTGHPGGLCTIHANSIESAPHRLEDLIQEAVVTASKKMILQAIDIIVFIKRDEITSRRKVSDIVELTDYKDNKYIFNQI